MKKRPKWGQNFLVDESLSAEIIESAEIGEDDLVLEIGPGAGILTELLLDRAGKVVALEIDPDLCRPLQKRFSGFSNFELIQGDALKFDFGQIGSRFKTVSNLPYYAATHILKRLIRYGSRIESMTVMLQKEVVDRLVAEPCKKEYSSLSVFIQYYCDVERILEVPKTSFSPIPKIDSSVICLKPLETPKVQVLDEKTFFKIVHASFLHKRKMLKNNLQEWKHFFKNEKEVIHVEGIDLNRRGETLSLSDFALISNYIYEAEETQ
jgi:16S rRNA (adenine1518-N6/adenine1519-N6)-dimethyltransferase